MDLSASLRSMLGVLDATFLSVGSTFSLLSLLSALGVATAALAWRRRRRGHRPIRLRAWVRALARHLRPRPTTIADVGYLGFNLFVCGALIGGALLSFDVVSKAVANGLTTAFGPREPAPIPDVAARVLITVGVFLAYELGYWLDHWLSHKVPFLWEFHRVHHSAEHLTPLTVWRVHPVETLKFANILILSTGAANGAGAYLLTSGVTPYAISGTNVILLAFAYGLVHLQHSHVWLPFTGWLGRVIQSPAHHQIHHSSDRAHHNRNFGSCLAIWDWMFGTLHVPSRERESLRFGVDARHAEAHTVTAMLIDPFVRAGRRVARFGRKRLGLPTRSAAPPEVAPPAPVV